jgi:hypothetical protein
LELSAELDVLRLATEKAEVERREIKRYAHELIERLKSDSET